MIGRLTGTLADTQPPYLMVDVQGVGYELQAPLSTFDTLPALGGEACLHTHMVVRDDGYSLFGFSTQRERELFRALIRINGVGPKLALTLLSGMRTDDLMACLRDQDAAPLTRIPGVGRKTAERLVLDMQDRMQAFADDTVASAPSSPQATVPPTEDPSSEAISALVALGYKEAEASRLVQQATEPGLASSELIRRALQRTMQS